MGSIDASDPDQVAQLTESIGKMGDALTGAETKTKNLVTAIKDIAGVSFNTVINTMKAYGDAIKSANISTVDLRKNNVDVASSYDAIANGMNRVLTLTTKFDAFKKLQVDGGTAVTTMSSQFDNLINRFGGWEAASKKLSGSMLNGLADLGEGGAKAFLESISSGQKLENTFVDLQGATGSLSKVFDQNNQVVDDLYQRTVRYGSQLSDTVDITNENIEVVGAYSTALGKIPNVIDTLVKYTDNSTDSMNGLTLAMTLSKGSGQDLATVQKAMKEAYEKLGNAQGPVTDNAKKGANMFALMSEASKQLNLRFDDTEDFMNSVSDSFKMFGDNSQSAANILAKFNDGLQATGLTAKQSVNVIKDMVSSMANLSTGQKALISSRNGGPGGLQGAFQFDNLLRHGKADQAYGMMEKTLRQQMGGRIYTEEEAGRSQQAASKFKRDTSLLTSGIVGKKYSEEEAIHIVEMMSKGSGSGIKALSGSDAAKNVVQRGQALQEREANPIQMLEGALDRGASVQSVVDLQNTGRNLLGTQGKGNKFRDENANRRNKAQEHEQQQYSTDETQSLEVQKTEQLRMGGANLRGGLSVIPNVATTLKDRAKNSLSKAVDFNKHITENGEQKQRVKRAVQEQGRTEQSVQRGLSHYGSEAIRNSSLPSVKLPKASEVVRHEIKPLEVHITVSRDKDTQVTTQTNYKGTTIKDVVNSALNGFHEKKQ